MWRGDFFAKKLDTQLKTIWIRYNMHLCWFMELSDDLSICKDEVNGLFCRGRSTEIRECRLSGEEEGVAYRPYRRGNGRIFG